MTASPEKEEDTMSMTATRSPHQGSSLDLPAPKPAKRLTNRDLVERLSPQLGSILPPAVPLERFKTAVVSDLNMLVGLSDLSVNAIAAGVIAIAQMGLEPGPSGQVGVKIEVDSGGRSRLVCFPTYKGVRELAFRTGRIASIVAAPVRPEDTFECHTDDEGQHLYHRPGYSETPAHLYYAVAYGTDGRVAGISVLRRSDVEANRAMSPYPEGDAWVNFYDKMACNSAGAALGSVLDLVNRTGDPSPPAPGDPPPPEAASCPGSTAVGAPSTNSSVPDPIGPTFSVSGLVFGELARDLPPPPAPDDVSAPRQSETGTKVPSPAADTASPDSRHLAEEADNWPEEPTPSPPPRRDFRHWSPPMRVSIDDLPVHSDEV